MWQTINALLNLAIFIEVLFLFTCGQPYMRMSILRSRRHYYLEKAIYACIGCVSTIIIIVSKSPEPIMVFMSAMMSIILGLKCLSAASYNKRNNGVLIVLILISLNSCTRPSPPITITETINTKLIDSLNKVVSQTSDHIRELQSRLNESKTRETQIKQKYEALYKAIHTTNNQLDITIMLLAEHSRFDAEGNQH